MPDLPTLTVTDAQAAIVLAAFGGNMTPAVPAYQTWLARSLVSYVVEEKRQSLAAASLAKEQSDLAAFVATLPVVG